VRRRGLSGVLGGAFSGQRGRYSGQIAIAFDVARAQDRLESATALPSDVAAQLAPYERAIATLTELPASAFSTAPRLV